MYKVSGFGELLPEEKIVEEKIINIIKANYQKLGYTLIETPAVEKNEVLTAKGGGEVSKQIYGLYGLAQGCDDAKSYSLHFDLTVPFARYVLDHKNDLTFPFKRSQIQKVWRGERAQRGRFREFYQCDIDVIWEDRNNTNSINLFYDAEVIYLLGITLEDIFSKLNLNKTVKINLNHKKIISGFIAGYLQKQEQLSEITTIIDKKDKISPEQFEEELVKIGLNQDEIAKIFDFVSSSDLEKFKNLNEELDNGIKDLQDIISKLELLGIKDKIQVNLGIMRGLDYYTGVVFETFIEGERSLGSIASGGRYEKLTSAIDKKTAFSGVGGSIGLSRLETYIFEQIQTNKKTSSDMLLINFESTQNEIIKLYKKLLDEGKNVELYPEATKLAKQFKYADKKGIRYCIILGEDEAKEGIYKIKDLQTGETISSKDIEDFNKKLLA